MKARCVVPAAGLGTRLRPVTRVVPKELLPLGTWPLLQWCLTEALEAGFEEIAVVVSEAKPSLETYVREGAWREGLLSGLEEKARSAVVTTLRQEAPTGVVGAVLAAAGWIEEGPVAVFLPDNMRIAGPPPLTAAHVAEAGRRGIVLVACHRVGPESRHFFADTGRAELDELAAAGAERPVLDLQEKRAGGSFCAPPEGAWRLIPRYTVTAQWVEEAKRIAAEATPAGREADDAEVLRRLVPRRLLRALPWKGTLVDAGNPAGYLWGFHLLHEAGSRERDALDEDPAAGLVSIEFGPR